MVASADKAPNKSAFLTEFLGENPTATSKAVNAAWSDAGHDGSISPTLVSKLRSDLGLTGNVRGGRSAGAQGRKPKAVKPPGLKRSVGRPRAEANGTHSEPARAKAPRSTERDQILAEIEGDFDRLIFKMMAVGGLESFEDDLRRIRRVLTRSHTA